jgi:acyl dehydratase
MVILERVIAEDELARTVGHRMPGGTARVEYYADWLLRDALGAPPPTDGLAHPTHAFLAAQGNVGLSLEEVFAVFGASSTDGPMLGEWEVEFAEPLRLGLDYTVTCVVESARRKTSARTGVFDLVTVRIELAGPDGRVHVTVRPTYVLPRR